LLIFFSYPSRRPTGYQHPDPLGAEFICFPSTQLQFTFTITVCLLCYDKSTKVQILTQKALLYRSTPAPSHPILPTVTCFLVQTYNYWRGRRCCRGTQAPTHFTLLAASDVVHSGAGTKDTYWRRWYSVYLLCSYTSTHTDAESSDVVHSGAVSSHSNERRSRTPRKRPCPAAGVWERERERERKRKRGAELLGSDTLSLTVRLGATTYIHLHRHYVSIYITKTPRLHTAVRGLI